MGSQSAALQGFLAVGQYRACNLMLTELKAMQERFQAIYNRHLLGWYALT
jgi:hypothetical protein